MLNIQFTIHLVLHHCWYTFYIIKISIEDSLCQSTETLTFMANANKTSTYGQFFLDVAEFVIWVPNETAPLPM